MTYHVKKDKILQALKAVQLDQIFIVSEERDYVLFQAEQTIKNGRCLITTTIDDRIYNSIHYFLGHLSNPGKKQKMLDLMNELNKEGLMVKYYLEDDDAIMARITYIVPNDDFDASFFVNLLTVGYNIIADQHYNQLMRLVWA